MSNSDFSPEELDMLHAIPVNEVKYPSMPIAVYIQEAYDLYTFSKDHLPQLLAAGLSPGLHESLAARVDLCIKAQSAWASDQATNPAKAELEEARQFMAELIRLYRYGLRQQPQHLKRIRRIANQRSNAALFQNLLTMAIIGEEDRELFLPPGLDPALPARARYLSDYLPALYAEYTNKQKSKSDSRRLRDRAFTLLKQAVDELRICGRYLFADNPRLYKGYCSDFMKKKASKQKKRRHSTKDNNPA